MVSNLLMDRHWGSASPVVVLRSDGICKEGKHHLSMFTVTSQHVHSDCFIPHWSHASLLVYASYCVPAESGVFPPSFGGVSGFDWLSESQ